MPPASGKKSDRKHINLALQGGGSHGAFTWGVLDRLLEAGKTDIIAVSGTSAGAMNAVVMADGGMDGGADGAREHLETFWRKVSEAGKASPAQRTFFDMLMGNWSLERSPGYLMMDVVSRFYSPYDFNPLNLNPLRDLLEETVDFDRVRACKSFDLHISATNVWNGKVRVFETHEVNADAVMASACLPFLFQAVEIEGVPYWDGGYMGNPVLFPFFASECADIVLVQINPIERRNTPRTAREILDRVNEITFNSSLLREFRAIEFVKRLIDEERIDGKDYMNVRLHRIGGDASMEHLDASSKLNTEWVFFQHLRDLGRNATSAWLANGYDAVGKRDGVDLRKEIAYTLSGDKTGY